MSKVYVNLNLLGHMGGAEDEAGGSCPRALALVPQLPSPRKKI